MAHSLHDFVADALTRVQEISPEAVRDSLDDRDYLLLDVREADEFAAGHIPGAVNVPRGFLEVRADLEHYKRDPRLEDRNQKIICYCGGGHRSALAADVLQKMGFKSPLSMAGGWTQWVGSGFPTEA